ncbi:hypothetical protein [Umezawaea tangerina]|uniref:Uncharacterized protein n=1 Tax=Umezawaea tangerina TaxID=84725 RepID=A0A2T0SU84_9PSEU|nr:hypothetical protein [Umezawaea tangerina]PRY36960.1 hypothetical protein CLV43_111332 [Umezawaea tangerina]
MRTIPTALRYAGRSRWVHDTAEPGRRPEAARRGYRSRAASEDHGTARRS